MKIHGREGHVGAVGDDDGGAGLGRGLRQGGRAGLEQRQEQADQQRLEPAA